MFAALTAPTVDDTGVMTFLFTNSISAVGAFVNHELVAGVGDLTIAALGISGDVLESYVLNISSPSGDAAINEGSFFGIGRANRDIYGFQLSGSAFVLDDLTVSVPAPPALALLALGLGVLGVSRRR